MRIFLILTILISFQLNALAQSEKDSENIEFVSYWTLNEKHKYEVTKVVQSWRYGIQTQNDTVAYTAQFEVIDSTQVAYTIRWNYQDDLARKYNIPESLMNKYEKYANREIIYITTEVGTFVAIENWQEIYEVMSNLYKDLKESILNKEIESTTDILLKIQVLETTENPQALVEQIFIHEILLFHFPMGIALSTTEPLTYEEELANMFGGKPIKGDAKVFVDSVDVAQKYCRLRQEMSLDPKDTKDLLMTAFKKKNLNSKAIKKELKNAKYEITDNNTYEYYYYPGLPIKIETQRDILMNFGKEKSKRKNYTLIEKID